MIKVKGTVVSLSASSSDSGSKLRGSSKNRLRFTLKRDVNVNKAIICSKFSQGYYRAAP